MQRIGGTVADIQKAIERIRIRKAEPEEQNFKCHNCGVNNHFSKNQWRIRCICGITIERSLKRTDSVENRTRCLACNDSGLLDYPVQYENHVYLKTVRCVCKAGDKLAQWFPLVTECGDVPHDLMAQVIFYERDDVKQSLKMMEREGA